MLMDLGPVVYVEDFEKHFLAEASEFYQVSCVIQICNLCDLLPLVSTCMCWPIMAAELWCLEESCMPTL